MPGIQNKRRRGEDEPRRPKKKIRNFKKQTEYHSSSEDEEVDAAAPIRRGGQAFEDTAKVNTRNGQGAKSKQAAPEQDSSSKRGGQVSDEEALSETAINTVLNMRTHESDDSEAEDDDDDDEGGVLLEELEDDEGDLETDDEDGDDQLELNDNDEPVLESEDPDLDSDDQSETSTTANPARKKRNDPDAFATSISKILTTKLSTTKRIDPILSRSRTADEANKALADSKLETKARAAIRAEKRSLLERGRVQDVLGLETPGVDTGAIMEEEKRLKKIAQRGVVKLFNAVRAAQVRAEEANSKARADGVVGISKREDRVNEMSKEGFLDLISRGGKKAVET